MPRITRAVAVGFPHHIVHRGNNRERIFFDKQDRIQYLDLLRQYSKKWKSSILAYCLMTNHVHLLTRPKEDISIIKMMQGVALCYTQYVNRKYNRTGRLWECRYHSSIVEEDHYLWAVIRYIEQNPCRARIVMREEEYPYSSARAHLMGEPDNLLDEELFNDWERKEYQALLRERISRIGRQRIRTAIRAERPFGSERFTKNMERRLGRRFAAESPGRPRHGVDS